VARKGGFQPGQSGNPGGRPKLTAEGQHVIELAREASPRAIGRLIELIEHKDGRIAHAAATSVLDRAYGKPTQPLANDPENPINPAPEPSVDLLARLNREQRAQLRAILGAAIGGEPTDDGPAA